MVFIQMLEYLLFISLKSPIQSTSNAHFFFMEGSELAIILPLHSYPIPFFDGLSYLCPHHLSFFLRYLNANVCQTFLSPFIFLSLCYSHFKIYVIALWYLLFFCDGRMTFIADSNLNLKTHGRNSWPLITALVAKNFSTLATMMLH